jgi:hypothetical protein
VLRLLVLWLCAGALAGCAVDLGPAHDPVSVIAGQVTLTTNTPVAGAEVRVSGADVDHTTLTPTNGTYFVGRLTGGQYLVEVVPPTGYAVASGTYAAVPVQLGANENKTVNFRLQAVSTSVPPQARN